MISKRKHIRSFKKEYLLFKKRRAESHKFLIDGVSSLISDEGLFFHIDSGTLQAIHLKTLEKGVRGRAHSGFKNGNSVDYDKATCFVWNFEDAFLAGCKEASIIIIPLEWYLSGRGGPAFLDHFSTRLSDESAD